MIRDLDETIRVLIDTLAPTGSELAGADISFDLPDKAWRDGLSVPSLTVNCYLYDIRQNAGMRVHEPIIVEQTVNSVKKRGRVGPPARIDCAYCITAWSTAPAGDAVYEEHRLLSQVMRFFLRHPVIPKNLLQGELVGQPAPYPGIIAAQDGVRNQPEFWSALDQKLKPSLNYVITLAMMVEDIPDELTAVTDLRITAEHL